MRFIPFIVLLTASTALGGEPQIVLKGNYAAGSEKQIPVGDWRNYGIEGYTGKLKWDYEAVPAIGYDAGGKPIIVYPVAVVEKADVELTPLRFVDGKFERPKVAAGDALVGSVTTGKIILKALGQDKDGFSEVIARMEIELVAAPRGPPGVVQPGPPQDKRYYFAIVRANAPATPEFENSMRLPAWKEIEAKGHMVRDFTINEAKQKLKLSDDEVRLLKPPVVYTLLETFDKQGKPLVSHFVGRPVPYTMTDDGIRKLLDVKP